jgi:hypothetical protein
LQELQELTVYPELGRDSANSVPCKLQEFVGPQRHLQCKLFLVQAHCRFAVVLAARAKRARCTRKFSHVLYRNHCPDTPWNRNSPSLPAPQQPRRRSPLAGFEGRPKLRCPTKSHHHLSLEPTLFPSPNSVPRLELTLFPGPNSVPVLELTLFPGPNSVPWL